MPTYFETARNKLRALKGSNLVSDIDTGFEALANDVDTRMASLSSGTHAGRPAAGQVNRFYQETDTGALVHDTGAAFDTLMRGVAAVGKGLVNYGLFTPVTGFDSAPGRSRYAGSIAHGLGVTPAIALITAGGLTIQENGVIEAVACSIVELNASSIGFVATVNGTSNNGTTFYWFVAA